MFKKRSRERNGSMTKIFLFITVLGSILSVSGVFGLASLNISRPHQRDRDSKSSGASTSHIVSILNKEFFIVLGISSVLGSIGGYYFSSMLLARVCAYHITIGYWSPFLCAPADISDRNIYNKQFDHESSISESGEEPS